MSSTRRYAPPRDASFIHVSTSVEARPSVRASALSLSNSKNCTGLPAVPLLSAAPSAFRASPFAAAARAGSSQERRFRAPGAAHVAPRDGAPRSARQLLRRRALSTCFHGRRARACGLAPPPRVAPALPRRRRGQPPAECGARAPASPVRARRAAWRPARRARQHTATRFGVAAAARPQQLTWAAQKTWCVHPRPQAACRARAGPRFHCVAPALPPCPR
jgi:hypothetical protein